MSNDIHIQHGVESGCLVTAQGTPDMTVHVDAGSVVNGNVCVSVAAQNVTITTADAAQDRYDLITVTSGGTVTYTAGTPADIPAQPETSDVILAYVLVYNQANALYTGTITSAVIQDSRRFVLRHISPYRVTGQSYGPHGTYGISATLVQSRMYLAPFFTAKTLTIDQLFFNLIAVFTATAVARVGIYQDDGAGNLTLLVDGGTVAIDTLGSRIKSFPVSVSMIPGWYWFAWVLQVVGPGSGTVTNVNPMGISPVGVKLTAGSSPALGFAGGLQKALDDVTGSLPSGPLSLAAGSLVSPPGDLPMVWVRAA